MASEAGRGPSASILLIDDNEPTRAMVCHLLTQAGYQVSQAANARTAVSLFDSRRPDLVITDMFMPDGDGFGVMKEIRHRTPAVPVIVISGAGLSLDVESRAIAGSAPLILPKPFRKQQLLDAVGRALGRKEP